MNGAEPRRWLLVSREMAVPSEQDGAGRWALDHLFLDQDAVPTLVEVKRSNDTRIRREVVGQMLDYAANAVVYWPIEALRAQFERNYPTAEQAEQALTGLLLGESEPEQFWQRVRENLQAGKVRMVFVADAIPTELQRIVEFLNEKMETVEVLAIEIKQYVDQKGQQLKTLVPRVIGQTARAKQQKSPPAAPSVEWDASSYFIELEEKRGMAEAKSVRQILEFAKTHGLHEQFRKGKIYGHVTLYLTIKGKEQALFRIWINGGLVDTGFYKLADVIPFDAESKRLELLGRLNAIQGISLDSLFQRTKSFHLSALTKPESMKQFLGAFDWFLEQIKQA